MGIVVFPGQGAQRTGMGVDFCNEFPSARKIFTEASEAIGEDLYALCARRDPRLHRTEFTQPCLLTAQMAAYRVLVDEFGWRPSAFGGHSLGEYSALVAAGALELSDAVRLVRTRGALMQRAVPEGEGTMAALVVPDIADRDIGAIIAATGAEIANDNSPDQMVISGRVDDIAAARERLAAHVPDLRFIPLRVSAPFHSRWMRVVEPEFAEHLNACAARLRADRAAVVTSNHTGGFHDPATVVEHLVRQISAPVRWTANMRTLTTTHPGAPVVEIGGSTPLTKFFATLGVSVTPLSRVGDLSTVAAVIRDSSAEDRRNASARGRPPRSVPATSTVESSDTGVVFDRASAVSDRFVPTRETSDSPLTVHRYRTITARMRLFCWPFAGGKAAAYAPWRDLLPDTLELAVVELPARQRHTRQTPLRAFETLVELAVTRVLELSDLPFAFFGHSLGALTAFEVARRLPGGHHPRALFLSGSAAPHLPRPATLSTLPDQDFLTAVEYYGGIPPEIRDTPEVMELFLPALRTDFELYDDYRFVPLPPPRCPAHLFGGRDDPTVTPTQLDAWRDVLPDVRDRRLLPGGHFFLTDQRHALVAAITDELARTVPAR